MNLLFNYNSFNPRTPEKGKLENSSTSNNIVLVNCVIWMKLRLSKGFRLLFLDLELLI
jgi:hypothetical protein